MPYFIYNIFPDKKLELLDEYAKYRDARDNVRERRKEQTENDTQTVRLVHARHQQEAERLLTTKREARPTGED
ncbi:MAG TPA: hypothetical protein ENI65_05445 [Gammaproteobacteria bacterium]|nr:hypothetical protein [Gammaproteobacteria bacterium]